MPSWIDIVLNLVLEYDSVPVRLLSKSSKNFHYPGSSESCHNGRNPWKYGNHICKYVELCRIAEIIGNYDTLREPVYASIIANGTARIVQ